MKLIKKTKYKNIRTIKIFDTTFLQYGSIENYNFKEKYCELFPISFFFKTINQIEKCLDKEYDLVFILRVNAIGEAYLLNFLYEKIVQNYKAKTFCFIVGNHNKNCIPIFNMFSNKNKIFITKVPLDILNLYLDRREFTHKNTKYCVFQCTLAEINYLFDTKYKKENYNIPYPTYLKQLWNVENYIHKTPILNNSIINKYNEYKNKNFIFLSSEAKSVLPINENFWKKLKAQINKKGYEIIQNEKNLTFEEAYYIASLSKGIITLRSGISELLSMLPIQQHIIYTKHKFSKISVNKTKEVHSIVNYPFVDCKLIYEYEYENNEKNNNEIIRQIIERI